MGADGFFRVREATISCAHDRYIRRRKSMQREFAYELMELDRLKRYVDLLKEFGFNSIQMSELWENYEDSGWQIGPAAFRRKVAAVADYARSRGMGTTLFVWGTGPLDIMANRGRMDSWEKWWNVCPCVKGGRGAIRKSYRRQAGLVKHFDHVITHWADPGGCQGGKCTIETAMRLHVELLELCRRENPGIESTFSLWLLGHEAVPGMSNWAGYSSVNDVLGAGVLPDEVGLAQGGRFEAVEARRIAKSGRRLGVWAWYLADNEIFPSMHVHTRIMGEYFSKLPRDAGKMCDWHTIDSNCHILNLASLYVGGQLLMDPRADAEGKLREFCEFAFGGEIASEMAQAYLAIANTRCRSDYLRVEECLHGKPFAYYHDEREAPVRGAQAARRGLAAIKGVKASRGYRSPLEGLVKPDFLIRAVRAHLTRVLEYAEFRAALAEARRKGGKADAAKLPEVGAPGRYMTQMESRLYRQHMEAIEGQGG